MRRIVSVVCPSFALWAQPHPNDAAQAQPWALTVERRNLVIVHDANPVARAAGAQPGQPLTDARALVPGLRSVSVDPARIERAWQATAHWLTRYTPLVALDPASPPTDVGGAAGFVLDVSGCSHLFGGEQGLLRIWSSGCMLGACRCERLWLIRRWRPGGWPAVGMRLCSACLLVKPCLRCGLCQ